MGSIYAARAMLLSLTLLLLFLLTRVNGQFPWVCPFTFQTMGSAPCCPVWSGDGSVCGINSNRGSCLQGPTNKPKNQDERLNYPWGLYSSICSCKSPYAGHDCGDCILNRHGATCNETYTVLRKEMRSLTLQERATLLNGLQMLKSTMSDWCAIPLQQGTGSTRTIKMVNASIYDCLAATHTFNSKGLLNLNYDPIHRAPGFLTFHRWYVCMMERAIQKVTKNLSFGMPFYEWRFDGTTCGLCNRDFFGASNSAGNIDRLHFLANWKVACENATFSTYCMMPENECLRSSLMRQPGRNEARLPSYQEVSYCMKWKDADTAPYNQSAQRSFRNCVEGWVGGSNGNISMTSTHNLVHVFLGGDLLNTQTAASDPMFFVHHCMVDSIFDWWLARNSLVYPPNNIVGHGPDDCIVGSFPPLQHKYFFQKLETFGSKYVYYYPIS